MNLKAVTIFCLTIVSINLGFSQSRQWNSFIHSSDTTGLSMAMNEKLLAFDQIPLQAISKSSVELQDEVLKLEDNGTRLVAFRFFGTYYLRREALLPATIFFEQALKIARSQAHSLEFSVVGALYETYTRLGLSGKSLELLLQEIDLFQSRKDWLSLVHCHSMLAVLYYKNEDFDRSITECKKIDSLIRSFSNELKSTLTSTWNNSWNTSGLALLKLGLYRDAVVHFDSARVMAKRTNSLFMEGLATGNMGTAFVKLGEYPKAITSIIFDIRISKKVKEFGSAANGAVLLGNIYFDQGKYILARSYYDSALIWNKPSFDRYAESYYKSMARLQATNGNFELAYQYQLKALAVRDSIEKVIKPIELAKAISKNNLAERYKDIQLLEQKNLLQQQQLQFRNVIIFSSVIGLVLLLFVALLFYRRYTEKKTLNWLLVEKNNEIEAMLEEISSQNEILHNQNEQIGSLNSSLSLTVSDRTRDLEEKNKELDTFIYRASHDIRRPITTLLGLEQLFRLTVIDPTAKHLFDLVSDTAKSMDRMLFKMQMVYELNQSFEKLEPIDLNKLLRHITSGFSNEFHRKNIEYKQATVEDTSILANQTLLTIIFQNLIENVIQFSRTDFNERPYIKISCTHDDGFFITVEDNGIGIEKEYQGQIFDLYFRGSHQSKGNGLGLYLVKKAVVKLGGNITVDSNSGKGSRFTIALPNLVVVA